MKAKEIEVPQNEAEVGPFLVECFQSSSRNNRNRIVGLRPYVNVNITHQALDFDILSDSYDMKSPDSRNRLISDLKCNLQLLNHFSQDAQVAKELFEAATFGYDLLVNPVVVPAKLTVGHE